MNINRINGFTMIEILIVLGILALMSSIVVLTLNPAQLIAQGRDAQRISDLERIDVAVQLNKNSLDETLTDNTLVNTVYVSLPDTNSNPNDNCGTDGEYSLPALTTGWEYRCVASSTNLRKVDGNGWIPVVFTSVSTNPLTTLPVDPRNNADYYYAYTKTNGSATVVESSKYLNEVASTDGGTQGNYYETTPIIYIPSGGDRYWVGGSGTWDAGSTAHWSNVSGGQGGFSIPVLVDSAADSNHVFFDGSSGGGSVLITTAGGYFARTGRFDTTGWTGSFATGSVVYVGGDVFLGAGQTQNNLIINGILGPGVASFPSHWTMNGSSILQATFGYTNDDSTANYILEDDLLTTSTVNIASSDNIGTTTLTLNNHNITSGYARRAYDGPNSPNVVINMGTGTWTLTGTGTVWDMKTSTGLTLNNSSSTIKANNVSSSSKTFAGGGSTYNNIWFTGNGTGNFILTGSNAFNDFKVDTPPHTIQFTAGTTTAVNTFNVSGTPGNLITIGSVTGAPHTLVKVGGGLINTGHLSISQSTATPASTWYTEANSINGGNNSGWIFPWVALTVNGAPGSPQARYRSKSVWDDMSNRLLMFGGYTGSYQNDLWCYGSVANVCQTGSAANTWSQIIASGAPGSPVARSSHAATWDNTNNRLLMFGGDASGSRRNDLWAYPNVTNQNSNLGDTSVYDQIYGGTGTSGELNQAMAQGFTTTSAYNVKYIDLHLRKANTPTDNLYVELVTGSPSGTVIATSNNVSGESLVTGPWPNEQWVRFTFANPVALNNATKYYIRIQRTGSRDTVHYYGWRWRNDNPYSAGGGSLRDHNIWNPEDATADSPFRIYTEGWTQLTAQGAVGSPLLRYYPSATWDPVNNRLLVFGGDTGTYYNDLWCYSNVANACQGGSPANSWSQLIGNGAPGSPSGRFSHGTTWDSANNRLLMFGGYDSTSRRNDLWSYTSAGGWTQLTGQGAVGSPLARFYHSTDWDNFKNRLLVFGGSIDEFAANDRNDLWCYSSTANACKTGSAANVWSELIVNGAAGAPMGRTGHSSAWDILNSRLLIFGGSWSDGSFYHNDLWGFK